MLTLSTYLNNFVTKFNDHLTSTYRYLLWCMVIIIPLIGAASIVGLLFVVNDEATYYPWIFTILNTLLVNKKQYCDMFLPWLNVVACYLMVTYL